MLDLLTEADAVISGCGLYRYRLTRRWADGPTCGFIMLNPSTADAHQDDPTIGRCISFAKREGCGTLLVLNLFAFRATEPAEMKRAADPLGPDCDRHLLDGIRQVDGPLIAAWGNHGAYRGRGKAVRAMVGRPMFYLALNASGEPKHPLYVKGDAPLVPFR